MSMCNSVFLEHHLAPGDVSTVTAAVRDLKTTYPALKVNVDTTAMYLWKNNPYLDPSVTRGNADRVIKVEYPLIHRSNSHPYPFIQAPRIFLSQQLGIPIGQGPYGIDVHLSEEEMKEDLGLPPRYWVLNAGFKDDFTNKGWEVQRFAEVVHELRGKVTFVQIGEKNAHHIHKDIPGTINMVGKTPDRRLLQVMYHAAGVLTGVSYPMHLSTMQGDPAQVRGLRPCVVLLGGREPIVWVQQRNTTVLHCCGALDCCAQGGCWKSRVVALPDHDDKNNSLCAHPVSTPSGQTIPLCMDMIKVADVVKAVLMYEAGWELK